MRKSAATAALLLLVHAAPVLAGTDPAPVAAPAPVAVPAAPVTADHVLPTAITVSGKTVSFDQQPVRQGERLYVPLRFIAEAAGGQVQWDGDTGTVTVTMPDRTAIFVVGQDEAEMNKRGVFYIRRNMIKMAGPVQLVGERTMVSADALTTIFGLVERSDADLALDLIADPGSVQEAPATGKVIAGEAQVTAVPVKLAEVPSDLQDWAASVAGDQSASYKVAVGADDNVIVGLAGGLQQSGGYTIELLGGSARLVDGTWYLDARVVPTAEPGKAAPVNPIAFFKLPGVLGNVVVHFWAEGMTP
jgi:hypothetical protein